MFRVMRAIKTAYIPLGGCFDTKALRTLVRLRRQDVYERQEAEAILDLYMQAIGMA